MRLAGIQGVKVSRYAGKTAPKYSCLAVAQSALAANGGSRLANAMGLAKEEEDVQSGSGFSFTDLAYDRAGAKLGELATGPHAAQMQTALAKLDRDAALTPAFADLPEFMPEAVFVRRFGAVGSPAYLAQVAEIERRLAAHPLYH